MSSLDTKFIRVYNSDGGYSDLVLGPFGTILRSNGADVMPAFDPSGPTYPSGFSYTQPWEKEILIRNGFQDFGMANFTSEFERASAVALNGSQARGPACYTSQCDFPWKLRVDRP